MKRLFSTSYNSILLNIWLLLLRIGVASLMLTHGVPKIYMLIEGNAAEFANPLGLGSATSLVLVIFAEAVCSVFILIGLATRIATIPLLINLLVIVLVVHADDPFARQEFGLLYLLNYLTLLVAGAGKYSFDSLISGSKKEFEPNKYRRL